MNRNRQEKGITLIALVITIVLLLILTGVAIKVSIDGKLFGRAHEAVDRTNNKVGELQGEVNRLLGEWDKIENGTTGGGTGNNAGGNSSGGGSTTPETPTGPTVTITRGTISSDHQSIPLIISATENTNGIDRIEVYKQGNSSPVETFNCNNEREVSKTYIARDNSTYTVKVYSKLSTTKSIVISDLVFPVPELNSYVNYSPKTAGDYKVEAKYSGYTSDQYITQTRTLRWKVFKAYDDGRIDLIAETPTDTLLYFCGALGFNNGVYLLNDLCKAQYSNEDYGAVGRSIDFEDIENRMSPTGIAAMNNAINGKTLTYTGGYAYSPDIYEKVDKTTEGESLDGASGEKMPTTATYVKKDTLFVKQTLYSLSQQASYYDSSEFYNLIFKTGKHFWLASRRAECEASRAGFGLRFVNDTSLSGCTLFNSDRRRLRRRAFCSTRGFSWARSPFAKSRRFKRMANPT